MSEEKADQIEGSDNQQTAQSLPPPVPPVPNQPPPKGQGAHAGRENESRLEVARFVVEIITLVVLFWYAWTTQAQLNEARRANNTAYDALESVKENSRLDQRAWVGFTTLRMPKMKTDVETSFEAIIANSGKTPALKVKAGIAATTWGKGGAFLPLYSSASTRTLIQTGTLFPGATSAAGTESRTLTPEEVRLLENGDQVLYVYGRIEYWDIFGRPHCTTFCLFLLNDLKTTAYCPTYNQTSDAECEK